MWQRGVAKIVKLNGHQLVVLCPHCGDNHIHSPKSLGSKEVVAGCHLGGNRCFSYAIPKRSK